MKRKETQIKIEYLSLNSKKAPGGTVGRRSKYGAFKSLLGNHRIDLCLMNWKS